MTFDVIGNGQCALCFLAINCHHHVALLQTSSRGRAIFDDNANRRIARLKGNAKLLATTLEHKCKRLVRMTANIIRDSENVIKPLFVDGHN